MRLIISAYGKNDLELLAGLNGFRSFGGERRMHIGNVTGDGC